MAEVLAETQALESTTLGIYRTATVVKGGRRFSFAALVVVGDRNGSVGIGYGKAPGVPAAIEKAQKDAKKNMKKVILKAGTLPHPVQGKFGASSVRLIPAAPGTGVIAGATVRAVLEMAGVVDCLTKSYGSNNHKNLSKAVLEGLLALRLRTDVEALRGVKLEKTAVDEILDASKKYMSEATDTAGATEKAKAPVNTVGQKKPGGKKGGRRPRRNEQEAPKAEAPAAAAPKADAPAEETKSE
ncbi:30S ribosomal protein S5 [Poriferisphaera corsica]|uniref:Small ribosomal subunit protein uS5 n=1 Tax=Poriferisphaera corsica TaxID=2528020 RepID=A0A517YT01_9BACT|nr:30S ribosomal protein S5 [Poriferisphaera corsica]